MLDTCHIPYSVFSLNKKQTLTWRAAGIFSLIQRSVSTTGMPGQQRQTCRMAGSRPSVVPPSNKAAASRTVAWRSQRVRLQPTAGLPARLPIPTAPTPVNFGVFCCPCAPVPNRHFARGSTPCSGGTSGTLTAGWKGSPSFVARRFGTTVTPPLSRRGREFVLFSEGRVENHTEGYEARS